MIQGCRKMAFGLIAAVVVAVTGSAGADKGLAGDAQKAVVELFTSQGCSSCPPADALLGLLAKRADVIALTFNVDYWDYLGWKDTLANPSNSARQRAYAKARKDGQVYTPQMVVGGTFHVIGSQANAVKKTILKSLEKSKGKQVAMKVWTEGNTVIISVGAAAPDVDVKSATVWLALVKSSETVEIERGENRGESITYHNVVREMTPVGQWSGEKVVIRLPKQHLENRGSDGCTALLQQDTAGPILAAAEMKKW